MRARRGCAAGLVALLLVAVLLFWSERARHPTGAWMARAGVEPRVETIDGLRIRYVRTGSGPPVVLLHGIVSSIYTWAEVITALAGRHDVVALDLPGFGGSDRPPDFSPDVFPRVVTGLMDRLGISRASLVGNSLGGAVAIVVAVRSPERVGRLLLIDSAGYNFAPADRPPILRLAESPVAGAVVESLPLRRLLLRLGLRQVFYDDRLVTEERLNEYAAGLSRAGTIRWLRLLLTAREIASAPFPQVIADVRVPTLILWGREDAWVPVQHAERFAQAIPGSRKVILDNCGHLPQEERPAELARLIQEFLPES